jgi:hypothetical protein
LTSALGLLEELGGPIWRGHGEAVNHQIVSSAPSIHCRGMNLTYEMNLVDFQLQEAQK